MDDDEQAQLLGDFVRLSIRADAIAVMEDVGPAPKNPPDGVQLRRQHAQLGPGEAHTTWAGHLEPHLLGRQHVHHVELLVGDGHAGDDLRLAGVVVARLAEAEDELELGMLLRG